MSRLPSRIALLGSTGSIGVNTLKVVAGLKSRFEITALSADSNIRLLAKQARLFKPKMISIGDASLAAKIKKTVSPDIKILCGPEALEEIVSRADVDIVVAAISGSSCIKPLIAAIKSRKSIALANKESLVSAGPLIMRLAKRNNVNIVPVDSEHSAIFQCIEGRRQFLNRIYLTATGGPLLDIAKNRFDKLPRSFILNHPKWSMGRKISVDSATMMNKGLEIIEAKWLFCLDEKNIEVLVHPEAIVHSMAQFLDGTVFAQLGVPDMRIPIQYALTYPGRLKTEVRFLGLSDIKELSFRKPDTNKFPCLALARHALKEGGTHPAVLNAADEEAVDRYLEGRINFSCIPYIIEKVLGRCKGVGKKEPSITEIFEAEAWAKEEVIRYSCR